MSYATNPRMMPQRHVLRSFRRVTTKNIILLYAVGLGNNLDETIDGFSSYLYIHVNLCSCCKTQNEYHTADWHNIIPVGRVPRESPAPKALPWGVAKMWQWM